MCLSCSRSTSYRQCTEYWVCRIFYYSDTKALRNVIVVIQTLNIPMTYFHNRLTALSYVKITITGNLNFTLLPATFQLLTSGSLHLDSATFLCHFCRYHSHHLASQTPVDSHLTWMSFLSGRRPEATSRRDLEVSLWAVPAPADCTLSATGHSHAVQRAAQAAHLSAARHPHRPG